MAEVQPKAALVRGVKITDFKVMKSRRPDVCAHTGQPFPEGTIILYKPGNTLTSDERQGLKESGWDAWSLVAVWDEVKNPSASQGQVSQTKTRRRSFEPSEYQQAIAETLFQKACNILISALAGCGKTATLVWLIWEMVNRGLLRGRDVYFLAFNANIRDEVDPQLRGSNVPALTTHQFCRRHVLKYKIDRLEKVRGERNRRVFLKVLMDLLDLNNEMLARKSDLWGYRKPALRLVSLMKNWAILPEFDGRGWAFDDSKREQVYNLVDLYKLDPKDEFDPEKLVNLACSVVSYSLPAPGIEPSEYDFDDMLYHVLVFGHPIPKVDLVFIDEVQDLNALQIRIVAKMEAAGTRIIAVGDRNQAIYMFRGADARAWERLTAMLQASRRRLEIKELPINYRSLPEILDYARLLVPGLKGFRKGKGIVNHNTTFDDMMDFFRKESARPIRDRRTMAVICRNRAPLVQAGYAAIGEGQVVCFLGKGDLTRPLHDMIDKIAGWKDNPNRCNRIADLRDGYNGSVSEKGFLTRLGEYVRTERAKYEGQEDKLDYLDEMTDTAECLRVIAAFVQDDQVDSIRREIDSRFVDKPVPGSITFTTVHGAKGLQWKVVFGIRKDLLPSPRVQQFDQDGKITDEYQQELNLDYIFRTRAEDECHVVSTWPFGKGMGEILDELPEQNVEEYDNFWGRPIESDRPAYDETLFNVPSAAPAPPPAHWGVQMSDSVAPQSSGPKPIRRFIDDGEPF